MRKYKSWRRKRKSSKNLKLLIKFCRKSSNCLRKTTKMAEMRVGLLSRDLKGFFLTEAFKLRSPNRKKGTFRQMFKELKCKLTLLRCSSRQPRHQATRTQPIQLQLKNQESLVQLTLQLQWLSAETT